MIVDERQVHYLEWGAATAPPVLCLHGGGQTAYMCEELGDALRDRYHVLAPDLPWHGDSDPIDDMGRQTLAASIPPLLREFGFERAAFVGASLGGIVSLTLAAAQPELVGAIALIDIGHRLEDEGVNRIIEFMTRRESFASLEEAAAEVAEYLPHRKQVKAENLRRNLRQRPDGRWEWKHALRPAHPRAGRSHPGGWRELIAGLEQEVTTIALPGARAARRRPATCSPTRAPRRSPRLIPDARLATDRQRRSPRRRRQPRVDRRPRRRVPDRERLVSD